MVKGRTSFPLAENSVKPASSAGFTLFAARGKLVLPFTTGASSSDPNLALTAGVEFMEYMLVCWGVFIAIYAESYHEESNIPPFNRCHSDSENTLEIQNIIMATDVSGARLAPSHQWS